MRIVNDLVMYYTGAERHVSRMLQFLHAGLLFKW
jgi:hypothetical protein